MNRKLFLIYCYLLLITTSYNMDFTTIDLSAYNNNLIPIAIVGAGSAGTSAAETASKEGYIAVCFDGSSPEGVAAKEDLNKNAKKYGAQFVPSHVKEIQTENWPYTITLEDNSSVKALSIIFTPGTTHANFDVKGSDDYWGKGVESSVKFLNEQFLSKEVIIVGGGDSACEYALELLKENPKKITIFVRSSEMRAMPCLQQKIGEFQTQIEICYDTELVEIKGDNSWINEVVYKTKNSINSKKDVSGIVVAIGHKPNTSLLKGKVNINEKGLIEYNCQTNQTSKEGIFAAGDVASIFNKIVIAKGDGARAALGAITFLKKIGFLKKIQTTNENPWPKKKKIFYTLEPLEYEYDSLEPVIDKETMILHHTKHHQTYVDNLNKIIENNPSLSSYSLEELLKNLYSLKIDEKERINLQNQGGGVYNHRFFFKCLTPHYKEPSNYLNSFFIKHFTDFDTFKKDFIKKAASHFGSGWCWLVYDATTKNYAIELTSDQDCPLSENKIPVFVIDLWEHAYYLNYQNKRMDYLSNIFSIINWNYVENNIKKIS